MFKIGRKKDEFQDLLISLAQEIFSAVKILQKMVPGNKDLRELEAQIKSHERRGDELIHDLIILLNKSFITPFDREDLHRLSELMDDVLDLVHACAFKMYLYHATSPIDQFDELARILERQVQLTQKALVDLSKSDKVLAYCKEINELENKADQIYHNIIRNMFENENDPIRLIKNKEIIEDLESATDACEDVADALESVVVKYA